MNEIRNRERRAAVAMCIAAAALFGASAPAAKTLAAGLGPIVPAGLLYLGAAAFVFAPALRERGALGARRQVARLGAAVVAGGIVAPVLLLAALARAPAASVSLWLALESVATAVLAAAFFHEHLGRRTWLASALVCSASIVLAAPSSWAGADAAILAVVAAIGWGVDNNLTATIDTLKPSQIALAKGLVGGGVNLTIGVSIGERFPSLGRAIALLGVGALGYGLSLLLYIRGAQRLGAARSQIAFSAAPFLGVLVAWALLREPITLAQLIAFGAMIVGIGLAATGRHEHEHRHEPMVHTHEHRHDDGHHDHVHEGLAADTTHTHEHAHDARTHAHPHEPDLHHRHSHGEST